MTFEFSEEERERLVTVTTSKPLEPTNDRSSEYREVRAYTSVGALLDDNAGDAAVAGALRVLLTTEAKAVPCVFGAGGRVRFAFTSDEEAANEPDAIRAAYFATIATVTGETHPLDAEYTAPIDFAIRVTQANARTHEPSRSFRSLVLSYLYVYLTPVNEAAAALRKAIPDDEWFDPS